MEISQINQSPTFSSLRMSSKQKIERKAGQIVAEGAQIARPYLEDLAENVDLHVIPYRNSRNKGLAITVTKPSNNPIKNFFTRLNTKYNIAKEYKMLGCSDFVRLSPLYSWSGSVRFSAEEIAEHLKLIAESLVEKVENLNKA